MQLALSSVAKDSSSSSHPWFGPILTAEEDDLGITNEPSDDEVSFIDDSDDHSSRTFPTPCALDDLELYDVTTYN